MKKSLRSAEILVDDDFNWQDMIMFSTDTRLEKKLVGAFDQNLSPENLEIEGMHDLKKFVKNNFGEKI
jgi:hypothetical protein